MFCVEQVCETAGEMRETKQATAKTIRREECEAMAEFWCYVCVYLIKTLRHVTLGYIDGNKILLIRYGDDSVHRFL